MEIQEVHEIVNLNEICRACLVKTENMKHLLDANEEMLELITKLSSVSNLEIEINNTLPCYLCNSCEEKLQMSYEFQQICQKSNEFILSCLASSSISLKINNMVKPIQLEDGLENDTSDFIGISNEDQVEMVVQNSYKERILVNDDENINIVSEPRNTTCVNYFEGVDKLEEAHEYVIENSFSKDENCTNTKPCEVDRKTKNKQTMRLPQYSAEEVERIIKLTKERFYKHVECLYCGFMARDSRSLSVHMTRLHKELKALWCIWCNKTFSDLDEHTKTEHRDNFKCPFCGKCRTNTGHFMEHLASHSTERKYVCKVCQKGFISARHLRTHYKIHTKDRPYTCKLCLKKFILVNSFNIHMKNHTRKCKICDESFQSTEEYEKHKCFERTNKTEDMQNMSEVEKDSQCTENQIKDVPQNYCEECKRKVRSLQCHREKHHSGGDKKDELPALCTYCGKRFKTVAKLTVHVRTHTGEAPYKCTYCKKQMTTRVHLVIHERTHTGEKPCICKICGKGFAQHSVLNTHMRLHTGRPEQCTICLKRFCRPSELRQHMRRHTGEKPFVCTFCGQDFKQKSHMVEHTKTHSDERPYKCDFCDKGFKHAGTLKAHRNIHLGKKPFKCSQCAYACRQSHSLHQHMLQHEIHHPKLEQDLYKCSLCDSSFTTLAMYSSHCESKHEPVEAELDIKDNLLVVSSPSTQAVEGNVQQLVE